MNVVFALVGVSIVLVIVITVVLVWAVRAGQFDDLEGPAWRVITDDDSAPQPPAAAAAPTPPERTDASQASGTHRAVQSERE